MNQDTPASKCSKRTTPNRVQANGLTGRSWLTTMAAGFLLWPVGLFAQTTTDYPATLLSQAPVGYWRLNETAQPPAPRSAANLGSVGAVAEGGYLFGAQRGQPGAFAGVPNTSVRFFNPDLEPGWGGSKVEVPYNAALNPSGAFSVELWAKPTTLVTDLFCMAASMNSDPAIGPTTNSNPRAGWLFYQNGSQTNSPGNQWQFRLGNTSDYLDDNAIRGGTVVTGAWHHIVGTFDGAQAFLYVNGEEVASRAIRGYQPNDARPLRIGTTCFDGLLGDLGTYAGNRGFDGWLQDVAVYGTALSPADIAAHYGAAKTNAANYPSLVLANRPLGYWRLGEPGNPPAANLGSLGAQGDGQYIYSAHPGQSGPQSPTFLGLEDDNRGCGFAGTNGFVDLPPLDLNTNTVTITAWILANTTQPNNAGIVFCRAGTTVAGLKFDINDPNGLSYNWNDDAAAYNFKSSLAVPVFQWSFVALIVQPDQATLCLHDGTRFATAVNYAPHPEQTFGGDTLIGRDIADPALTFNGIIDEVAIFNRALSVGEVYSQFAAGAGNLKPSIFADPQGPIDTVHIGETLSLGVDAGGTPPLNYQWRKDGTPIAGATASTLSKANLQATDSGMYDVIVSNPHGSATSQQVRIQVEVLVPPNISQGPQGRTLYVGGTMSLSVQASGGGLNFQWRKDGTDLAGATNSAYSVSQVSTNDSGVYEVIVSNRLSEVKSATATVMVLAPASGSYEEAILSDNPESWWRLDDPLGATTLMDSMGRHDGAYLGGVTQAVPGVLVANTNTAASFDGSSGYAEVPFSKALNTTNFTIECWVRADSIAAAMCPVASFTQPPGRGYLAHKSNDGVWSYMFGDGSNSAVYALGGSDAIYSQWTHLALTYDGFLFSAFLNGAPDAWAVVPLTPNNVAPLRIGFDQMDEGWSGFWRGEIDEVTFYPTALSDERVAAHYAAALYGSRSKPVFTRQPASSMTAIGSPFLFVSVPEGSVPMQLQWTKNGATLPGSTNSYLFLPALKFSDTAVYQLTASNAVGVTTSEPATLAVVPIPSFANVTNDLVLHLTFDGNYQDSSGRGNHGRAVGSPRFVAGAVGTEAVHVGTAVDTSVPDDPLVTDANYITLGSPPDLQFGSNVNFSVSYWVRVMGSPGDLPFLCNSINSFTNPGYTFAPSYEFGGWSWCLGDVGSASFIGIYGEDDTLNDGSWHHVAHTFERSGSGLTYLDGAWVDSRSIVPAGDLDTGEPTNIGQDASGAYPEAGEIEIDDLGVWRRALTPFEVYSIYAVAQEAISFDTYGPVSLVVTHEGGAIQLVWQAGTLMEANDALGPWSPVAGATAPYHRVPPGTALKFYRVRL